MKVLLVHGLWLSGWSMQLMARRLESAGFETRIFSYRSTLEAGEQAAAVLAKEAREWGDPALVGHSLGGLVVMRALQGLNYQGRAVLLGSPIGGSVVARRLGAVPVGRWMLGEAYDALATPPPAPPEGWQIGMIAGNVRLGMGWMLGGAAFPGDGTVALDETRATWLADHVTVAESHTSLQLGSHAAEKTANFLKAGSFSA